MIDSKAYNIINEAGDVASESTMARLKRKLIAEMEKKGKFVGVDPKLLSLNLGDVVP